MFYFISRWREKEVMAHFQEFRTFPAYEMHNLRDLKKKKLIWDCQNPIFKTCQSIAESVFGKSAMKIVVKTDKQKYAIIML